MNTLKTYLMPGLLAAAFVPAMASAQTGNFYGGVGVHSSYFDADESFNLENSDKVGRDSTKVSVGIHGGYRYQFDNRVFVAGEVFYLNTKQDKTFSNGDKIEVGDQYGTKVNVGYEWQNGISAYGIAGVSYFDYDLTLEGDHVEDDTVSMMMGGGVGYRFNPMLSAQLELTTVGDDVDIAGDKDRSIGTTNIRLAMSYDF